MLRTIRLKLNLKTNQGDYRRSIDTGMREKTAKVIGGRMRLVPIFLVLTRFATASTRASCMLIEGDD